MVLRIYFAGELFDHKHITGNSLLAKRIEDLSRGLYKCMLPQDWEDTLSAMVDIRNNDIKELLLADFVIFNFDGPDLDSGTAVEFFLAKMLDIPAVLLRTDSRDGGHLAGEDWNVMLTGYPRCAVVKYSALVLYNTVGLEEMQQTIANAVIEALQKLKKQESVMSSYEEIWNAYQHVIKMSGSGLEKIIPPKLLREMIVAKIRNGIYSRVASAASISSEGGNA